MERLSIDEVIEHCKRNTQRWERAEKDRVRLGGKPINFETDDMSDNVMKEYWEHRQVAEWLEQLKAYKEAEEQGLLLRLPCKAGNTVWVIDEDTQYPDKKKIYEAKWTRVTFVQVTANHPFELRGEVSYQVYDYFYNDGRMMPHGMYVGQLHTKVGEVVFLTKEEAEKAFAKLDD